MGKVISFGDSFVVGLGTDREYEQSLKSGHILIGIQCQRQTKINKEKR